MRVQPRLDFYSHDHSGQLSIAHGDDRVLLTIRDGRGGVLAAILVPDEAEQLGRNLVRQARHARAARVDLSRGNPEL